MLSCCYLSFPGRFLDGRGLLPLLKRRKASAWGSHGGTMGSLASLELWGTGLISGPARGLRIWHCCSCSSDSIPGPGTSTCHRGDFLLFLLEQLAEKCEFCPHPGRQPLPAGALNWGSPQRPKLPRELREAPKDWAWVWVAAEAPDPRPARRNHGLPCLLVYGPRTARLSAGSNPRLSIERSRQVQKEEKTGGG